MTTENALQALVVLLVVWKLYALGAKKRYGWLLGVGAEIPWLYLALYVWHSWALVALAALYAAMYGRNFVKWRKETACRYCS